MWLASYCQILFRNNFWIFFYQSYKIMASGTNAELVTPLFISHKVWRRDEERQKLSKCWIKYYLNSFHCLISHASSNLRLFHTTGYHSPNALWMTPKDWSREEHWISMFPWTKWKETLRFEGNKIHCFPRDQSLSDLLSSKTKQKKILKNTLRSGDNIRLPSTTRSDHVQQRSTFRG